MACCNRGLCIHRLDDGIVVIDMESDRDAAELTLLANLREQRANLAALYSRQSDHWGFEDPIYRFYHQSWKVFALQSQAAGR